MVAEPPVAHGLSSRKPRDRGEAGGGRGRALLEESEMVLYAGPGWEGTLDRVWDHSV